MLIDLHAHTVLCNHAYGEMRDYVLRALKLGIAEFGFAEHSPWMIQDLEKLAPDFDEIPLYVERVQALQKEFNHDNNHNIKILLGFEMDFLPDKTELAREYTHKFPFDYTIGSVHHINSWGFDQETQMSLYRSRDIRQIYEQYFDALAKMIHSQLFNIVGHIDLVKKFGFRPQKSYRDIKEKIARLLSKTNMVVELNTSGFDRPVAEPYPDFEFLQILNQHKVPVTLGSDAHSPSEVGRYFKEARNLLTNAGYSHITTFRQLKPLTIKL